MRQPRLEDQDDMAADPGPPAVEDAPADGLARLLAAASSGGPEAARSPSRR